MILDKDEVIYKRNAEQMAHFMQPPLFPLVDGPLGLNFGSGDRGMRREDAAKAAKEAAVKAKSYSQFLLDLLLCLAISPDEEERFRMFDRSVRDEYGLKGNVDELDKEENIKEE